MLLRNKLRCDITFESIQSRYFYYLLIVKCIFLDFNQILSQVNAQQIYTLPLGEVAVCITVYCEIIPFYYFP